MPITKEIEVHCGHTPSFWVIRKHTVDVVNNKTTVYLEVFADVQKYSIEGTGCGIGHLNKTIDLTGLFYTINEIEAELISNQDSFFYGSTIY